MQLYKRPLHIERKRIGIFSSYTDLYRKQDNYKRNNAQYYVESCQANTSASFIHIFELVGIDIKFISEERGKKGKERRKKEEKEKARGRKERGGQTLRTQEKHIQRVL